MAVWKDIYVFAPDLVAVLAFCASIWTGHRARESTLGARLVDKCINKFGMRRVQADLQAGLIEWVDARISLEECRQTVRMTSLIALSGVLGLASEPSLRKGGLALGFAWIAVFAITSGRRHQSPIGSRELRTRKVMLLVVFSLYIALSVGVKVVALEFF